MSGTLYVVATPIGNLEDITLRALRVLRTVSLIAAEDTRRTSKLLAHYTIATPTISFHEHNTRSRLPQLMSRLQQGESVAIVSDAGTPGVSDPGVELVQACITAGVKVEPIPGPSATLSALVASGYPTESVVLLGFPPARGKARKTWMARIISCEGTTVFFESPHRIKATLSELANIMGDRPITVGRELTKVHEEFLRGSVSSLASTLREPKGEMTLVLGPVPPPETVRETLTPERVAQEFGRLTDSSGLGRRSAVSELAKRYGYRSREVYALLERVKNSGE